MVGIWKINEKGQMVKDEEIGFKFDSGYLPSTKTGREVQRMF